jgi:hypothetical protein
MLDVLLICRLRAEKGYYRQSYPVNEKKRKLLVKSSPVSNLVT